MIDNNFQSQNTVNNTYNHGSSQQPYNVNPHNNQSQLSNPYTKPHATYNQIDRIFSVIALILGFAILKNLLNSYDGIGFMTTLVCLGLTLFNCFYCKKKGLNCSKENKVIFIITLILSVMFVITDNDYVKSINVCLVFVSNMYFVYSSYKSNNNSIILNVFKAVVLSPFYEYGSLFAALLRKSEHARSQKSDKTKKNIVPVIVGLVLSIPVCVVVMVLLMSSDENFGRVFEHLFETIFEHFFDDIFDNAVQLMFSIPISMYIFSAVFSRAYKMKHEKELNKLPKVSVRVFPSSMCNAFLSPLILIYVAFVFTQVSYLFTNIGTANENFDYSEYARNGFFELCFVALINLSVISVIIFFVKLKDKLLPKSVKIFVVLFSVLTLCLIVTAIVKMQMYINMYGMTPLRIYTLIFMIYLFVMFIVMIVKQFVFKMSFTKIAYVLGAFVIAAMSLLPVDGLIAKYNIEKYEQGEIGWMGYSAMTDLDASAVSVFAECNLKIDSETSSYSGVTTYPIMSYFKNSDSKYDNMDIYNFNFTRLAAKRKIEDFNKNNDIPDYHYGNSDTLADIKSFDEDGYQKFVWEDRIYAPFCTVSSGNCGQVIGCVDGKNYDIVSQYSNYPVTDWIANYFPNDGGAILYKAENVTDIPNDIVEEYKKYEK